MVDWVDCITDEVGTLQVARYADVLTSHIDHLRLGTPAVCHQHPVFPQSLYPFHRRSSPSSWYVLINVYFDGALTWL